MWKIVGPTTDIKTHKNVFYNKPYDLKGFDKVFLSKIGSKTSFTGKLLMDYASSIAFSTFDIIVNALNVSNCSASAGINSIQAEN